MLYDAGNDPDFILKLREQETSRRDRKSANFRYRRDRDLSGQPWQLRGRPRWWMTGPKPSPLLDAHIAREPDVLKLTYEERGLGARGPPFRACPWT